MAYGSVLDPGRYPLGVVWVDLPSEELDVNVHPQKAEVRFARGREAFDDVTRAIMAKLGEAFRSPLSTRSYPDSRPATLAPATEPDEQTMRTASGHVSVATERLASAMARGPNSDPWGLGGEVRDAIPETRVYPPAHTESAAAIEEPQRLSSTLVSADAVRFTQEQPRLASEYGSLRFLAQLRSTYLLCEGRDAIYVIDQHAAAERVTFARLREGFAKRAVERQQLLVPEVVSVRGHESALIDEAREELLGLGVDARAIGDGKVAVHGVPSILTRRASPERILRDVLDELAKTGERKFGDAVDLVLATMACHGSVRAGDTLHPEECNALLRDLDAIDFAGYCPHGRPIVTVLPYIELEKKVGRR